MNMVVKEEQILINDILDGKRSGFRQLYDLLFPPLYAFGNKYLEDNLMLEDFVQESFVSFWNKRKDFDNLNAVKSYLYTTVRNSCLNYVKHQSVKRKNESHVVGNVELDSTSQNNVIEEETFNQLYVEIKNLPESTQEVMLLALNGLKNPQIAEELGVSINTVKTLKKNAYSKLKKKLSPFMQSYLFSLLF